MAIVSAKLCRSLLPLHCCLLKYRSINSISPSHALHETVKNAVEAKAYEQIPDLLVSFEQAFQNPNPFAFLSTFPDSLRMQVVDEILQSFIPIRPRFRAQAAYAYLLSFTLQSSNPLPLGLAVLQRTLRSGCVPVAQTRLFLSSAWLNCRKESQSVSDTLFEMQSIGYHPDSSTCNYLIWSLCDVDQLNEAVKVLKGMNRAGCVPDLESFDTVVRAMCRVRKTSEALDMIKKMVEKVGLTPRQGTIVKVAAALRANREIWRAVELIEFLERKDYPVGFESYDLVVKGCLDSGENILAGKVVMRMTEKGFIPYIRTRHKVVDRLAGAGEWKLAYAVRQRFAELRS
ncbi:pentatricopeptide repeat-containing protein At1g06270 [Rosa rugosa]|uniref:pentatricopeptide repeat-containing protein At1g06270 n=1 Tax=Rosa rugosa TaxID=74645 RepID=UPI002B41081B|nr:pentatricopeptide repeat-containing protein At1g06270 [Rosa rugosa]XP_062020046.1 pentatricopeptide repeat-containing protein At1g06270 [Rosa rugosa]XP_062020047.1 pentatricopeptide repeat-containing protein At1g06270 [Rosa rugosa]XP_062020048.1 pentatricopeptide repeat-containing protein At1g06270 [Rosa rugosa]XP_062020049.1 pentatricopeptide repeat-containing protein At1g06270 [Rosa rugosa]XP_062020050.1 pentatricopeptide repeat-containing protein At1g06270 [Rosa rugosa]XP_062020051.1 pe